MLKKEILYRTNKYKMSICLVGLVLCSMIPSIVWSQGYDTSSTYDTLGWDARSALSREAVKKLKDGVLIVRLKTGNSKMKAFQRLAESETISSEKRAVFQSKMDELAKEVQQQNEWLVEAMNKHYTFSEVLYIADTMVHHLKGESIPAGIFMNGQLEVNPNLSLQERAYLITFFGATKSTTKSGLGGMVVIDEAFKELVDPFPHFTGLTTARKSIGKFFNKKDDLYFLEILIQRFNRRITDYYEQVK